MWSVITGSEEQQGRSKPFFIPDSCPGPSEESPDLSAEMDYPVTIPVGSGKPPTEEENWTDDSLVLQTLSTPLPPQKVTAAIGSTSDIHLKKKLTKRSIPLVEIEVRRSTRLKALKGGFMRKPNLDQHHLPGGDSPPYLSTRVIKNLCLSYCQVPPDQVSDDRLRSAPAKIKKNEEKSPEFDDDTKN